LNASSGRSPPADQTMTRGEQEPHPEDGDDDDDGEEDLCQESLFRSRTVALMTVLSNDSEISQDAEDHAQDDCFPGAAEEEGHDQ
jgi:hypothetical protein